MARIPFELAYARRMQAHALRSEGLSIRAIAAAMVLPVASVQNYLASVADAGPIQGIADVLALKSEKQNAHRGPLELRAMSNAPVSSRTLSTRIAAAGLARQGAHRSSTRAPYHTEAKPTCYLDMLQMDTKKLRVGNMLVELLVVRDVATGCTIVVEHSQTGTGMLHKVAYMLAAFGGSPRVFQTDNGATEFSMARRDRLRPWHKLVFARGAERVQFIPEAEPRRNGSVESFNSWLQSEWDNHGSALEIGPENFNDWLHGRMRYYNFDKPLSSTGKAPASLSSGRFNPDIETYSIEHDEPVVGCVSFVRYVTRSIDHDTGLIAAVAPVKSPGTIFVVPFEFEGSYLRFDCHLDGTGLVHAPREVDTLAAMHQGHKVGSRRFVGRADPGVLVGSFTSPFVAPLEQVIQIEVASDVLANFVPTLTDPMAIIRTWKKVLKQAIPEILPSGIRLVVGQDGTWQAWRNDELIWTEQSSPEVLEHAREGL